MAKTKICSGCKKKKSIAKFYKNKSCKDGLNVYCKECSQKIRDKWYENNPEKYKKMNHRTNLGKRNLTVDEFDSMLEKQKGLCAICNKKETRKNQFGFCRLSVDHNHLTNKNRGLLCAKCNTALGAFDGDNGIDLLLKAIKYIKEYDE